MPRMFHGMLFILLKKKFLSFLCALDLQNQWCAPKKKKDEGEKNLYRVRNPFEILRGFNFDLRPQPIYLGPLPGPSKI
jgi:hypothetical protein